MDSGQLLQLSPRAKLETRRRLLYVPWNILCLAPTLPPGFWLPSALGVNCMEHVGRTGFFQEARKKRHQHFISNSTKHNVNIINFTNYKSGAPIELVTKISTPFADYGPPLIFFHRFLCFSFLPPLCF